MARGLCPVLFATAGLSLTRTGALAGPLPSRVGRRTARHLFTAGSAGAALIIGRLSHRLGRREYPLSPQRSR